jgi:hypothetical protein
MRIQIRVSGIFLTLDPESGMENFGSGINIPDPKQCKKGPDPRVFCCGLIVADFLVPIHQG